MTSSCAKISSDIQHKHSYSGILKRQHHRRYYGALHTILRALHIADGSMFRMSQINRHRRIISMNLKKSALLSTTTPLAFLPRCIVETEMNATKMVFHWSNGCQKVYNDRKKSLWCWCRSADLCLLIGASGIFKQDQTDLTLFSIIGRPDALAEVRINIFVIGFTQTYLLHTRGADNSSAFGHRCILNSDHWLCTQILSY